MTDRQQFMDGDRRLRRYAYDDRVVFALDFGSGTDATVDVVDGTAIVVAGDEQFEFEVPAGAQAFIHNGVLTVEVDA